MAKVIKYLQYFQVNRGTEEEPEIEEIFPSVTIDWNEDNEELAKREAYKGEYIIEDDGLPEPDKSTTDDVLNALLGV